MRIALERSPDPADAATLSEGIVEFNRQSVPNLEEVAEEARFHVIAREEGDTVSGGIRAVCYWNTLHIELLWIAEAHRGSGLGRTLLESAEAFARKLGCCNALVETTSWQARPFYETNGYALMATLPDRPKGHASHYLSKSLV